MQTAALDSLSREELIDLLTKERDIVSQQDGEITYLRSQLEMYKRMQLGQKRERFEGDPAQIALPFEAPTGQTIAQEETLIEKISYVRSRPNHKGRAALPSHLPVEEIKIYPAGDLSEIKSSSGVRSDFDTFLYKDNKLTNINLQQAFQ